MFAGMTTRSSGVRVVVRRGTPPATGGHPQGLGTPAPRTPPEQTTEVPPPPEGMTFTTHLDHTAVWVGDQFHYTIIVDHSAEFEFVLDTLTKETSMSRSFLRQGRMNGDRENRTPTPPYLKIGRSVRYLKEDLDTWLEQFRQCGE